MLALIQASQNWGLTARSAVVGMQSKWVWGIRQQQYKRDACLKTLFLCLSPYIEQTRKAFTIMLSEGGGSGVWRMVDIKLLKSRQGSVAGEVVVT